MKSQYRVVIIGGGVVGASVLYHLTKFGWTDIALIERAELTAGSTWHAAAGFHPLNADPNIAALQAYTIKLYREIEEESGQDVGVHMTGGVSIASTPERWEWLKSAWAIFQTMGVEEARLLAPDEIRALNPIADLSDVIGGLYDPHEGHLDPYGTTHAYAGAAKKRGADVILRNRVIELIPREDGSWDVVTEQGTIVAEHVVNAAGLWAKQVGLMAGVDLPVTPMEHHYLVTEPIKELEGREREMCMLTDLEGFTYSRQERGGLLMGVYEMTPKHWNMEGAPWDYGIELIPEDIDRIAPELQKGFERYPVLNDTGIRKWVNGAFTFAPDGNPLVGPVRGLKNYWCACGVMAGFSQGGGVGLALANWMTSGDPGFDIWGMDVSRFGDWTTMAYTNAKVRENYSRRFKVRFPNEELTAARPLRTTPIYERQKAANAVFGVAYGMEQALWYAPEGMEPVENITFLRSNAFDPIKAECKAVRGGVGLADISSFAKYEVTGPGAESWLSHIMANKMPRTGRLTLSPMLNEKGKVIGDFTVGKLADDHFYIFGSGAGEMYHMRWFEAHLPQDGSVTIKAHGMGLVGLTIAGPKSRDVLATLTDEDVSGGAFKFLDFRRMDMGMVPALVGRVSFTGDLGYEMWVKPEFHGRLFDDILKAGAAHGIKLFGSRAMRSMSLEKGFGSWATEYRPIYGPFAAGMGRFVDLTKNDFIGREAAAQEKADGPKKRLVTFAVAAKEIDVMGNEPIYRDGKIVGYVTSGMYAHHADRSVAMGYVPADQADDTADGTFRIEVFGEMLPATILSEPLFDPKAERMRG